MPKASISTLTPNTHAFKHFIANGDGRGFILVSHSQGSTHLIRLVQEEIEEDTYLAKRMITAHLIGWTVALPNEAEVGATASHQDLPF